MGKYSDFPRKKNDSYDTPISAVKPLIRHLPKVFCYDEPCAGSGSLLSAIDCLDSQAAVGVASDIEPRADGIDRLDALTEYQPFPKSDFIITNPPWTRSILHPMIERFSNMRPTWLLFDANWAHTKQAASYMKWCRKIVSVGRVKWVLDSPHTGKEDGAWDLFDQHKEGATVFVGRQDA